MRAHISNERQLTGPGVGVGDASASPTAALLLNVIQESMGRIATILFAHKLGTSLEPECKMYRLAADVFNDTAMVLDCLSPAFPKTVRVLVLSFSSVLRSLCGVCAGSSKASLSAHFATRGNLGELNAVSTFRAFGLLMLFLLKYCFFARLSRPRLNDPSPHLRTYAPCIPHVLPCFLRMGSDILNTDLICTERLKPRDCYITPGHAGKQTPFSPISKAL